MFGCFPAFISTFQQAFKVQEWNRQILQTLPEIPPDVAAKDPEAGRYLRARKRVFTDFELAARKLIAALLRSGCVMLFDLQTEVFRLLDLTLHEVEELYEYLAERIQQRPEEQPVFGPLVELLAMLQQEISQYEHGVRFR